MTALILLQCSIAAICGIALQILFKLRSLKKRSEAASKPFIIADYFKNDWLTILITIVTVFVALLTFSEFAQGIPMLLNYMKFFFVFVGFTGSSIIQVLFSVTEKKILKVIDEQSPKADGIV